MRGDSSEVLIREIREMVNTYWDTFQEPVKLAYIASRFNRRAARIEINLRNLVLNDLTFNCRLTKRSGVLVVPKDKFDSFIAQAAADNPSNRGNIVATYWSNRGVPLF